MVFGGENTPAFLVETDQVEMRRKTTDLFETRPLNFFAGFGFFGALLPNFCKTRMASGSKETRFPALYLNGREMRPDESTGPAVAGPS